LARRGAMQPGELLVGSPPRRWAVSVCCGPMVLGRPTGQLLYPTLDKRRPLGPPPTLPRTTGGPSETDCLARQPSLHPRPSPPPPSHHTARARRPHWQRPRNATRSGRRASHARGPPRPGSGHSRTDVMSTRPRQPRPTDASGGGWSAARLRQHALPLTACQRGHTRRPQRGTVRARCVEGAQRSTPRAARVRSVWRFWCPHLQTMSDPSDRAGAKVNISMCHVCNEEKRTVHPLRL